jgi:hypothetical protein
MATIRNPAPPRFIGKKFIASAGKKMSKFTKGLSKRNTGKKK